MLIRVSITQIDGGILGHQIEGHISFGKPITYFLKRVPGYILISKC